MNEQNNGFTPILIDNSLLRELMDVFSFIRNEQDAESFAAVLARDAINYEILRARKRKSKEQK
jgi:hypothetical protein